jgi:hypothetical protein
MSGQLGHDVPDGNFTSNMLFAFSSLASYFSGCPVIFSSGSSRIKIASNMVDTLVDTKCKLKNARERIKSILLKCHKRLCCSDAATQAFRQHLAQTANLNVKRDTEPFPKEVIVGMSNPMRKVCSSTSSS